MADAKITALTALAAAATGDILPIVDDPTGAPETKKITVANLAASIPLDTLAATTDITDRNASSSAHGLLPKLANTSYSFLNGLGAYDTNLADGWISRGDTWTYASASTFTVAGDVTSIFQKGRKLKLTQTTVKYFYVVSSSYGAPNTTVTVTGGSTYTVENAAITNNYYSYADTPAGFPDWFTWDPLPAGWSSDPPDNIYKFKIVGRQVFIIFHQQTVGTSDATNTSATLPVSASTANANAVWTGNIQAVDNGTTPTTPGLAYILASGPTQLVFTKTWAAAAGSWTGSGNKRIAGLCMFYEI